MTTDLERQIVEDIDRMAHRVGAVLGLDITDTISGRARDRAPMVAAQLTGGDARVAAATAIDIMAMWWPESDPPGEWWSTPLGRAVAATTTAPGSVTRTMAARILGVSQGRVTQLLTAGRLVEQDGGVSMRSVMDRLT